MKRCALFLAFAVLVSIRAHAAEPAAPSEYATTLVDGNCVDSFTGGRGDTESGPPYGTVAANGRCDSSRKVLTGALTADTVFGPFRAEPGEEMVSVLLETSAVAPGGGTVGVCLAVAKPYEAPANPSAALTSELVIETCATPSAASPAYYDAGALGIAINRGGTTSWGNIGTSPIPRSFYLILDVNGGVGHSTAATATSWTGSLGLVRNN